MLAFTVTSSTKLLLLHGTFAAAGGSLLVWQIAVAVRSVHVHFQPSTVQWVRNQRLPSARHTGLVGVAS